MCVSAAARMLSQFDFFGLHHIGPRPVNQAIDTIRKDVVVSPTTLVHSENKAKSEALPTLKMENYGFLHHRPMSAAFSILIGHKLTLVRRSSSVTRDMSPGYNKDAHHSNIVIAGLWQLSLKEPSLDDVGEVGLQSSPPLRLTLLCRQAFRKCGGAGSSLVFISQQDAGRRPSANRQISGPRSASSERLHPIAVRPWQKAIYVDAPLQADLVLLRGSRALVIIT